MHGVLQRAFSNACLSLSHKPGGVKIVTFYFDGLAGCLDQPAKEACIKRFTDAVGKHTKSLTTMGGFLAMSFCATYLNRTGASRVSREESKR